MTVIWTAPGGIALSGGNLTATSTSTSQNEAYGSVSQTRGGDHYFEVLMHPGHDLSRWTFYPRAGIQRPYGQTSNPYLYYSNGDYTGRGGGALWAAWVDGDTISVRLAGGNVYFYRNGTLQGSIAVADYDYVPYLNCNRNIYSEDFVATADFGASAFAYTKPLTAQSWDESQAAATTESVPMDRLWAIQSNGADALPFDRSWQIQAAITSAAAFDRQWAIQIPEQAALPFDRQWGIQAFASPPLAFDRQWAIQAAITESLPFDRRWAINPPRAILAATKPHAGIQAWGGNSSLNRLAVQKPQAVFKGLGGGVAGAIKPHPAAAAVMTGGGARWQVKVTARHAAATAFGWAWPLLAVDAVKPHATAAGRSGWSLAVTAQHAAAGGAGQHRLVASLTALKPHAEADGLMTRQATLTVAVTAHHAEMGLWAQAAVVAHHATIAARLTPLVPASAGLAYVTNLRTNETTRYDNYPFRWIVRAWGRVYGVAADGLYRLEGETDAGAPISATVETRPHLLGTPNMKFVPVVWISGSAPLLVRGIADGRVLPGKPTRVLRAIRRAELGKGTRGRVWAWRIENVDGGRMALRTVDPQVIASGRRI